MLQLINELQIQRLLMVCVLNPEWPHGGGAVSAGRPLFQTLVVTEGLMSLWGGELKQAGLHGVNVGVNRRFVSVPGPDQFKKKRSRVYLQIAFQSQIYRKFHPNPDLRL